MDGTQEKNGGNGGSKLTGSPGGDYHLETKDATEKGDPQLSAKVLHQQPSSSGQNKQEKEGSTDSTVEQNTAASSGRAPLLSETIQAPFIFDHKLHERLMGGNKPAVEFKINAAKSPWNVTQVKATPSSNMTLQESAQKLEELGEGNVVELPVRAYETGEEGEKSACKAFGKLFIYEKAKVEKGGDEEKMKRNEELKEEEKLEGTEKDEDGKKKVPGEWRFLGGGRLKLNDMKTKQPLTSRLILREKNGAIILNSKIFSTMIVMKKGARHIIFSGVRENKFRIFVFVVKSGDVGELFDNVECRIHYLIRKNLQLEQEIDGGLDSSDESDDNDESSSEEESDDRDGSSSEEEAVPPSQKKNEIRKISVPYLFRLTTISSIIFVFLSQSFRLRLPLTFKGSFLLRVSFPQ